MSKTIRDRGISTFTLPEKLKFSFDVETRKIELNAYFKYCATHNLLVSSGEQSRISLIRKTFNHMGGSGSTAEDAMRSWLQVQVPSVLTDLNELWKAYFLAYSTTPDSHNVTYAGLSVEAGYRKFLYEFIGLTQNYYDTTVPTDNVKKKMGKRITENQAVTDLVSYMLGNFKTFADNITATSAIVLSQNKKLIDTVNQTDSSYKSFTKVISEGVAIQDTYSILGGALTGYKDSVPLTEIAKFQLSKVFTGDSTTLVESIAKKLGKVVTDSVTLSDSASAYIVGANRFSENMFINEVTLIMLNKNFADTISPSDTALSGYVGFGAGVFGQYIFSA